MYILSLQVSSQIEDFQFAIPMVRSTENIVDAIPDNNGQVKELLSWCTGTVCNINTGKNFGFIKPSIALDSDFNQKKDVHFSLNNVVGPSLASGSGVNFVLDPNNKEKPDAIQVQCVTVTDLTLPNYHRRLGIRNRSRSRELRRDIYEPECTKNKITRVEAVDPHCIVVDINEGDECDETVYEQNFKKLKTMQKIMLSLKPIDRSNVTYSRKSIAFYSGLIQKIWGEYGRLLPDQDLPKSYEAKRGVRFKVTNVKCALLPLRSDDRLTFKLSTKDTSDPFALSVSLHTCRRRSVTELSDYISLVFNQMSETNTNNLNIIGLSPFLVDFVTCPAVWECLGNVTDIVDNYISDILQCIVQTENKARHLKQDLTVIFDIILSSPLFDPWNGPLKQFLSKKRELRDESSLVQSRKVLQLMLRYVPEKSSRVASLIQAMVDPDCDPFSLERFLWNSLKEVAKVSCTNVADMSWNDMPLIPSPIELLADPEMDFSMLLPVKTVGAYESLEEYHNTYFRLLRADCFSSLRQCMQSLLEGRLDHRDMNVYHEISVAGIQTSSFGQGGLMVSLKITPQHKQNWATSTNLMYGNLLCISPMGTFNDPIWAVVVQRDPDQLKKNGTIYVEFCTDHNTITGAQVITSLLQKNNNTLMVESPSFYGAYKPIMQALQEKHLDDMPFQEEIIYCKPSASQCPPKYLQNVDVESYCHRSSNGVILDEFQHNAMKLTFKQRMTCIQGPPGTGKTFIGIQIVQRILSMPEKPACPILLVTYKNHALDEFLVKMQDLYPGRVARVGGRSNEESLEACNLNVLVKGRIPDAISIPLRNITDEVEAMKEEIRMLSKRLNQSRYLTISTLINYLSVKQLTSLLSRGSILVDETKLQEILPKLQENISGDDNSDIITELLYEFRKWCPKQNIHKDVRDELCPYTADLMMLKQKSTKAHTKDNRDDLDEEDVQQIENERMIGPTVKTSAAQFVGFDINPEQALSGVTLLSTSKECLSRLPFVQLMNTDDLHSLTGKDRARLLQCLLVVQAMNVGDEFDHAVKQYQELCRRKNELFDLHKANVLSSMSIIGMTITGANMNRSLLAQVKPAIVLVEEAAEVGETHLMALLGEWVQHLILIGDHKQLRPQVQNYSLVKKFKFDVSMMERLIENNVGYTTLYNQNRMHPEISKLLRDIYPRLQDNHIMVSNHRQINCITKRLFFWDHSDPEKEERSFSNPLEADRVVNLAIFMIQQGNNPDNITILAPYQGQVRVLRDKLRIAQKQWSELFPDINSESESDTKKRKRKYPIQIQTIDQYQGDENDFIIVSLTRSNPLGKIGFLRLLNRRCVAQSRAKCGLYIIGNVDTITSRSSDWRWIVTQMSQNQNVSDHITVMCPQHPHYTKDARMSIDIPLKESFCRELCLGSLPCRKHSCEKYCQPPHRHVTCMFQCDYICDSNHRCSIGCYPDHAHQCKKEVEFVHKVCGHRSHKKCHANPEFEVCNTEVSFQFPVCHHTGKRKCWEKNDRKICKQPCIKLLPCQHICNMKCGETCNVTSCQTCEEIKRKQDEERRLLEKQQIEDVKRKAYAEVKALKGDKSYEYVMVNEYDEQEDEYRQVEKMVKDGIPNGAPWLVKVHCIHKIYNPAAQEMWYKAMCSAHDPTKTALKFLRTNTHVINSLEKTQFTLNEEHGEYGVGVYLSSIIHLPEIHGCMSGLQSCLIVDTLIGKVKNVEYESNAARQLYLRQLKGRGLDSVQTSKVPLKTGHIVDEMAVSKTSNVLPLYKVDYNVMILDMLPPLELKALLTGSTVVEMLAITSERELKGDDPLQVQFKVAEATFLRLLGSIKNHVLFQKRGMADTKYKVTSVDYCINPNLLQRFLLKMDELSKRYKQSSSKFVLAFHGTKRDTSGIFHNNFDLKKLASGSGDQGLYGAGIYLSEFPQTGLFYGHKLLLCRVLTGKCYDMSPDQFKLAGQLQTGYDSHRVHVQEEGHGEELVIFDPDQILPVFEIHYSSIDM